MGFANLGRGNAASLPQFNPTDVRGNSAFSVLVPEDGIYPFRILFWQGGGGVNVEFFSARLEDGQQALVGDATDFPWAIPAYRSYIGPARPWVKFSVSPTPWDNLIQQTGPGPLTFKGRTPSSVDAVDTYNRPDLVSNVNTNRHFADVGIGGVL
ncbi:MAG: hypothetical protein HYZ36_04260, partial [Pedosphaera parvula]|nr:hypothetical protein [Pedosphaera parvula]